MGRVFSFSTLLTEKWEWVEGMGWSLMFSGTHHSDGAPPSAALVDIAGSLFKFLRQGASPCMQEGCLGEKVHFFILIAERSHKKLSPLSLLLSPLVCICAKAGGFDVFMQGGYVIFSL